MSMRIRKIHAHVGLTIKTGDYNNARVELGAEAEVGGPEGLSLEESDRAHAELCAALRDRVGRQVEPVKQLSKDAQAGRTPQPTNGSYPAPQRRGPV